MKFTWDHDKNLSNQKKHNLSFEEILNVFDQAIFIYDKDHSSVFEDRFIAFGKINKQGYIVVVFIEIFDETYRIISARKATKNEVKNYAKT